MTVIMGSFWSLRTKVYNKEQNLNFTHDALQEMRFEFQKATFLRKLKKTSYFQIIASAVWFHVFRWNFTYLFSCFFYITNKSPRICLNILGDSVIQSLKSGKARENGLVPMSRQEKLADLFLAFPARLETWPKAFHSYSFIKRSRNEAFMHFLVNSVKRLPWKRWTLQKFRLQSWLCICKFFGYAKFHYHQVAGEKVMNDQNFQIFCFWPP